MKSEPVFNMIASFQTLNVMAQLIQFQEMNVVDIQCYQVCPISAK